MTRDEGVALIQQQLVFRTTLASEIASNMVLAQTMLEIAPTKPWFLVSERSTVQMTIGDERVPVPEDFLEELDENVFEYVPSDGSEALPLDKGQYDELKAAYFGYPAGPPEQYALLGDYFRFFPLPDLQYNVRMIYYKRDLSLTTNIENGWLKHVPYLLLGTAGLQIAEGPLRDTGAAKVFTQWTAMGMGALYKQNEARRHANMDYQIGGRHW